MNREVAQALWQYANGRRQQEFVKWTSMPARTPEKQVEAQRMKVADWAEAANELYAQCEHQAQKQTIPMQ